MTKPLRPFFKYFGSKWRIAGKYPAPTHTTVIEPFAGSAGYSLHYPGHRVVLCEAYAPVAEVWAYLIDCARRGAEREILALPDLGERRVNDLDLPPGPSALIGFWLFAGAEKPRQRLPKAAYAASGLFWGPRVRERIAEQLRAIRHWTILPGPYQEACPVMPDATYFIDPPYQKTPCRYGAHAVDYNALALECAMVQSWGAQVIVCEAEGADWLPFRDLLEARTARGAASGRVSREVIWP